MFIAIKSWNISIAPSSLSIQVSNSPVLNRMSERSGGDSKICEIVVDKVKRKDLGKWRSKVST